MNLDRRTFVSSSFLIAALTACKLPMKGPALVSSIPKGKPGEFDFLNGEWTIKHQRRPKPGADWDAFDGEATCWTILGGIGSVEELRIPARDFSGMGLRLLDAEQQVWNDLWVNAKSGVLTGPGTAGGFRDGAGIFESEDMDGDKPIIVRGIWDEITPKSCRWRQGVSHDGGKSFDYSWIMHWTRRS